MTSSILQERHRLLSDILALVDRVGALFAYLIALAIFPPAPQAGSATAGLTIALAVNALIVFTLLVSRPLRRHALDPLSGVRNGHSSTGLSRLMEQTALDAAILVAALVLFPAQTGPLPFVLVYLCLCPFVVRLCRGLSFRALRSNFFLCLPVINIVIVGANERGHNMLRYSKRYDFLGFHVIGFIDDENRCGHDVVMLGGLDNLTEVLRDQVVDVIFMCLPIRSFYDAMNDIFCEGEMFGIPCEYQGGFFSRGGCSLADADDEGYISDTRCCGLAKRLFDITGSIFLLLAFSPFIALGALAILLDDGGPIFFLQPRMGFNKRVFNMFKLRSMRQGAEKEQTALEASNEMGGPVFKIRNDPRVTRVGRLLRKYNIDETPQFLNVLFGQMSLVGPRPMSVRDFKRLNDDWARRRFSVKPGVTCYWQTRPDHNSMTFEQWMELDMRYLSACRLSEDIKICLKTIPAVIFGRGV